MRYLLAALAVLALAFAGSASAADYKTLHAVNATPPTQVPPLPAGAKAQPVQFVRMVVHPPDGEPWALEYGSIAVADPDHPPPPDRLVPWNGGAAEQKIAPFARVFDEELQKAGFSAQSTDLFDDNSGSADLKVAVLVDELKGRFCRDCPNLFNRKGVPASVMMTAHWEVYSTLERKVVAKITTSGAGDSDVRWAGSYLPGVLEGFRENVRQLLASDEFRRVVTAPASGAAPVAPEPQPTAFAPMALSGPATHASLSEASKSVAIVYAADGSGSGFLVSSDGYLVTNRHVVGASKFVKLKWADGSETLGEVVRSDPRRDVALVKTQVKNGPALALRLSPARQGEPVYAIGSPLGDAQQNTMTKGIVSALRVREGLSYIQSDVAVTHGNSGGPLLDEHGAVIGITVSGLEPNGSPVGINFFIPIADALKALDLNIVD